MSEKQEAVCERCLYYELDEDGLNYICTMYFDEDDIEKISYQKSKTCRYFKDGDEYKTVKHQM